MSRRNTPDREPALFSFAGLLALLCGHVQMVVRNGKATERGLAIRSGVSQSHLHNVLKGARQMSPYLADKLLRELSLTVADLLAGVRAMPPHPRKGPASELPMDRWRDRAASR